IARDFAVAHDNQAWQIGGRHLLQASSYLWANKQNRPFASSRQLLGLPADFFAQFFDRLRSRPNEQTTLGMFDAGGDLVFERRVKRQHKQAAFRIAIASANRSGQTMANIFGEENKVL